MEAESYLSSTPLTEVVKDWLNCNIKLLAENEAADRVDELTDRIDMDELMEQVTKTLKVKETTEENVEETVRDYIVSKIDEFEEDFVDSFQVIDNLKIDDEFYEMVDNKFDDIINSPDYDIYEICFKALGDDYVNKLVHKVIKRRLNKKLTDSSSDSD